MIIWAVKCYKRIWPHALFRFHMNCFLYSGTFHQAESNWLAFYYLSLPFCILRIWFVSPIHTPLWPFWIQETDILYNSKIRLKILPKSLYKSDWITALTWDWFWQRSLPVKREFVIPTVASRLLLGNWLLGFSFNVVEPLTYNVKHLELHWIKDHV